MLPFVLIGIDLLHAPRRPLGERCRTHVPFVALVGAYFVWRWCVLGLLGAAETKASLGESIGNTATRALQLAASPGSDGQVSWLAWLGLPMLVVALAPWAWRLGTGAVLLPLWLVGMLVPTHHMPATHGVMFGRLLFDAVPAFALLLGVAAAGGAASTPRWLRWLAPAALLLWLAPAAATSRHWLQRFDRDDADAQAIERALATTAADFTPDRPLAITALPFLPLYHTRLWGVLALHPFAASDLPVLGLPELINADSEWPQFFNDAAPVHAVRAAGGALATLAADPLRFQPLAGPGTPSAEFVAGTAAGEFVVAAPWPGAAVQRVVVTPRQPAQQVRLRLLDDFPDERGLGWLTQAATNGAVTFDLTHATAPALLQAVGLPFRGVRIEVDGAPAAADTRVIVHDSLPGPPAEDTTSDATGSPGKMLSLDEMEALSLHPPQPEPLRLYVLLPTGARHMDVPSGGAPMGAPLQEHLRYALRMYAPVTAYWFWQTPPNAPVPWRSRLLHAVVHFDAR